MDLHYLGVDVHSFKYLKLDCLILNLFAKLLALLNNENLWTFQFAKTALVNNFLMCALKADLFLVDNSYWAVCDLCCLKYFSKFSLTIEIIFNIKSSPT